MTNWIKCKLGDILTLQRGHDLSYKEMKNGEIPVVGSNGIIGYHDVPTTKKPCVTIGRSGNIGHAYYYNCDCWAHNTVLYVKDFKGTDPKFSYYLLKSMNFSQYNVGSAVPTLNRNHIHPIEISYPPLPTQKKIAAILSSLDDKIEINTRMNKVLEEIARALFHRWFVEFEFPNDEGKPYKSSGGRMIASEMGEIPEGWRVGKLDDLCLRKRELVKPNNLHELTNYIGLEHMPQHHMVLYQWGRSDNVTSTKQSFTKNDLLFGTLRPYFHKVGLSPISGICSTDILVLTQKYKIYLEYSCCIISSDEFVAYSNSASEGTRMPRAKWSHMCQYMICIPPVSVMKKFQDAILPLTTQIINNIYLQHQLCPIRDTLLPKLMNGGWILNENSIP